jgi:hypothetical protein
MASGALSLRRRNQLARALRAACSRELMRRAAEHPLARQLLPTLEGAVLAGEKLPSVAARELSDALLA